MLAAVGSPEKQDSELAEFNRRIGGILKDVEGCGAPADAVRDVAVDLATASGQVMAAAAPTRPNR